ncbi:MAG: hypothetical protein J6N78_03100 [Clostridia bacterium]|nr:hypothetical protein [Clostridia bacterium]
MENNRPEYLYRGMCIRYDELKDFIFSGIDMELPYQPYIDEQGKETVHDGNEYGIYMSDNPKVAEYAYGNATNKGDGTYIEPRISIGNRGTEFIKIPAIGVCYKISTQGLDIRKPWISSALQGVYNNGLKGDEWITNKIPAENYEIMSVQIGKDLLHDEQYIDLNDIENIKEKTTQILEQRKARLELFAQEMSKIPEQQRKEFGLGHLEIFKEIYGENGFYYMENIDEIDTSSNIGMIRFLMANVYKNNAESIDFGTLLYLQDIKEKAEFMQKKGKELDLKEYFANNEKILEIMEQSENEKTNLNGKFSTVAVKQNQTVDSKKEHNKNEDTQNYVDEKDSDVVDYYEKYGIDRDEKWETIKEKLKKEQKKWMKRSSSTNEKEVLDEVFQQIDEISEVLALFKPGNEEKRKQYDAKLDEQKQRQVSDDNVKEEKSKIGLEGIGVSIRNNPTSLEHLREIQQQMASQIKTREKNRNSMQPKSTNQTEIDDIEK